MNQWLPKQWLPVIIVIKDIPASFVFIVATFFQLFLSADLSVPLSLYFSQSSKFDFKSLGLNNFRFLSMKDSLLYHEWFFSPVSFFLPFNLNIVL